MTREIDLKQYSNINLPNQSKQPFGNTRASTTSTSYNDMSDPSSNKVFKNHRAVESPFAYATSVFLQLSKNKNMYTQNYMYVNSPPVASQSKLNRSWKRWHLFLKHAQQITKIAKPVNPGTVSYTHLTLPTICSV